MLALEVQPDDPPHLETIKNTIDALLAKGADAENNYFSGNPKNFSDDPLNPYVHASCSSFVVLAIKDTYPWMDSAWFETWTQSSRPNSAQVCVASFRVLLSMPIVPALRIIMSTAALTNIHGIYDSYTTRSSWSRSSRRSKRFRTSSQVKPASSITVYGLFRTHAAGGSAGDLLIIKYLDGLSSNTGHAMVSSHASIIAYLALTQVLSLPGCCLCAHRDHHSGR